MTENCEPGISINVDTRGRWEKRVCACHGLSASDWGLALRRCNELYPFHPQTRRNTLFDTVAITVGGISLAVNGWLIIMLMGDSYPRELDPLFRQGAMVWSFTCLLAVWAIFFLSRVAHNTRARLRRRRHILHFLEDYDHNQSTDPRTSLLRSAGHSDMEARATYLRGLDPVGDTQPEQLLRSVDNP